MNRRTFLKVLGGGLAVRAFAGPVTRAFADAPTDARGGQFFVLIHASGGWDVTLWADPRNEKLGLVAPATTDNTDIGGVRRWVDAPFDGDVRTFELVHPTGSNLTFGPGIGDLADLADRLTIVNGLAMNTVSHPDGTAFSSTGRHLVGGRAPASSLDTILANELGREQTFPVVSVQYPSFYVGEDLDRRVVPLTVGSVSTLGRTLARSGLYDTPAEREAVTALLGDEARAIAERSEYPGAMQGMGVQLHALQSMLGDKLQDVFSVQGIQRAQPQFAYRARFGASAAVNAAFAVEAMKRNVVRCVSFAQGGFDTHGQNYKTQAQLQQELFDTLAVLVKTLDVTPHPTLVGKKLADTTHILVISDFCRTPQINQGGGRDHYPNNSALVISPRFRGGFAFGKTDKEQLLPGHAKVFSDGERAIAPPDLLATLIASQGIDPRKYLRDGEVVKELLRT